MSQAVMYVSGSACMSRKRCWTERETDRQRQRQGYLSLTDSDVWPVECSFPSPSLMVIMVALCNRADHYIFAL